MVVKVWRPSGLVPWTENSEVVAVELAKVRARRRSIGSSMPVVLTGTLAFFTSVMFAVGKSIVSSISVNGIDALYSVDPPPVSFL